MNSNLVAGHILLYKHLRSLNDTRANNEEGRCKVFGGKVVKQFSATRSTRCAASSSVQLTGLEKDGSQ
jgi:hypothetical protein